MDYQTQQVYEIAETLAGTIGYEEYCVAHGDEGFNYGINIGHVVVCIKSEQIMVGGCAPEDIKQTRDEFVRCLWDHSEQLKTIRATFATALPQPIAEELAEYFTIMPALARYILQVNKYKFLRCYHYSDLFICPHLLDDPFCDCA